VSEKIQFLSVAVPTWSANARLQAVTDTIVGKVYINKGYCDRNILCLDRYSIHEGHVPQIVASPVITEEDVFPRSLREMRPSVRGSATISVRHYLFRRGFYEK
jgi:hypothetical protein